MIDEDSLGLDTVLAAGPGGNFLDRVHTARHFRAEHWEPRIWSRQMLRPWMNSGEHLDTGKAREYIDSVERQEPGPPAMEESCEQAILRVIEKARMEM